MFPEALQHIDEQLMLLINRTWSNHFFDVIMPPVRDKFFWIPLYFIIAGMIVWKLRMKGIVLLLVILANFGLSDQLSSAVIKPAVARTRPCNDPSFQSEITLRIDACGAGKSFTSSHAANTFALATLLTLLFRRKFSLTGPLLFFWAFLVSYAQVYVGVHYPLDIIGGALLGILISVMVYFTAKKILPDRFISEL